MSSPPRERILKPQPPPAISFQRLDTPTLLGHPHQQASPQETEPFWQQQPEIAYPYAHFYPELDLYTEHQVFVLSNSNMVVKSVVIGSKSSFARPVNDAPVIPKRPRETVKIYLQDQYVGEISFGVLIRFSKLAKVTFPKPAPATNQRTDTIGADKVKIEGGQADLSQGALSNGKDWAEMSEQSEASKTAQSQNPDNHVKAAAESRIQTVATPAPKELTIAVPEAWIQPKLSTVKFVLTWMEQNKRTRQNEPLLPLTPEPLPKISLIALVDIFTAVLAYDLAPFPRDLRHEILTRLTQQPTVVESIRYLYERLPVNDPIISRMVTSFFEHNEAGNYTKREVDAIYEYIHEEVDDGGELERHFDRVKRNRTRKQSRGNAMETLRKGFETFAGPMGEASYEDAGGEDTVQENEGEGHRRRNRREQKEQGQSDLTTGSKGKAA